ncbi:unnamed protein product [Mytilus coruscus]|uniref:Reverse transcriptase domain-containing protein n=1 Tax=Mytilus coruscus TaxID=42192 RepID=A0A6J8BP04_MYTCO|nr:unnamed protein product [Mytilus coruscus]
MFQHQSITKNEIEEALKLLNLNKSPDIFGISTENLLYGGQSLIYHLKELLDITFRLCYIPDEQKLGIVIPLFKNKGSCKDSKNYRGITITPTLSKLIEAVLKIRINPDIIKYQNPLQRGFTRRIAPFNCSFIIEEFHKECVELNDQTIITMLDAKSAFDAVNHAGLIRRLCQMKFPEQSILIIDNLYKNAVSCVKWKNQISDTLRIEQGLRQGNSTLPTSKKATHIGICRTDDDSCKATIDENLKKARRTLYSLMGVGLYGENGLDPQTSMSIMNTYIIPIMLYGLEIVIPRGRCLETLNIQLKQFLKQLLSLPKTVADLAIYMISGMLSVEAQKRC